MGTCRRICLGGIVVSAATIVVLLLLTLEHVRFRWEKGYRMAVLGASLWQYRDEHGTLPCDLTTLEAEGLFGGRDYRAPLDGLGRRFARRPHYLPLESEDISGGWVIAVEARTCRTGRKRGYIILGDTSAHFAADDELSRILRNDDLAREAEGHAGRWRETRWRETFAGE